MMTALHIEEHEGGILRFLRHNRIRVEHRYCDSAQLKCIIYANGIGKGSQSAAFFIVFPGLGRRGGGCPPA